MQNEFMHWPKKMRTRKAFSGDPAQLPIASELWKMQQEAGYTGKHYSICGIHWLTGIPYTTLMSVISSQN